MKRSVTWMAAVVVLGTVAYVGSSLGAKPAPEKAGAPARVGLLNLRWVIKKYERYKDFIEAMKKEESGYLEQLQQKQKQIETLAKQADGLQGEAKAAKEAEIKDVQRDMEDIKLMARKEVTKKSNDEMVVVYKEVRDAATRHAKTNNIDLVLHYEGAADKDEVDSSLLVTRNMNAGGCVPMYWNPELDISQAVLDALNANHKRGK